MSYALTHWRGQQGLAGSALLNGLLAYVILVVALSSLGTVTSSPTLVFGGLAVFLVWLVWAGVGIFRCGTRNALDRNNKVFSRIGGVIAISTTILVAYFSIADLNKLGILHLPH